MNAGHERSVRAKKNTLLLFFVKGGSVLISFVLVPLTLDIVGDYRYGVWITLFNVLSWINIFDIGIGNGLRNKFSASMAKGDIKKAKEYVSTAYILMSAISLGLISIFVIPWHFVSWGQVFNVENGLYSEVNWLIGITFNLTAIQFSVKLMGTILVADHKPALSGIISTSSNLIILIIFLIFREQLHYSLVGVGGVYTGVPILIFLSSSVFLFSRQYKKVRPSISFFRKDLVRELFSLGGRFFIIQIAVLVIFQTDALIISHTLSPDEVTPYNVVFRYFGIITMLAGIVLTPLWSAFTDAHAKKDYIWMRKIINIQLKGFICVIATVALLFIFARPLLIFWMGVDLQPSLILLLGMALYAIISVWNNIFSFFLNGTSNTKTQIRTSIIGMLVNIPLSIYLAKNLGNGGVVIATCLSLSFFAIFGSLDTFKYLKNDNPIS